MAITTTLTWSSRASLVFSSRRRHTRCALVTGVQTCALPICLVQLFDSWAGSLSPAQYEQWVIAPNADIVRRLKALHPDTPVIGFPKGAGGKLRAYADETGVDAVGIDETVDPAWADAALQIGRAHV